VPGKSFGIPEGISLVGQFAADVPVGNAEKIPGNLTVPDVN